MAKNNAQYHEPPQATWGDLNPFEAELFRILRSRIVLWIYNICVVFVCRTAASESKKCLIAALLCPWFVRLMVEVSFWCESVWYMAKRGYVEEMLS